jgi:UDP-2,3-diacylglucosamine pyrophosphatase LpxH
MNTTFSIKILNKNKPLLFLGDHHGEWDFVFDIIKTKKIENCYIICVGDGGEGFMSKDKQLRQFDILNNRFKKYNIEYKSIRGNHSDPSYFQGIDRVSLSNFELIEDYTVAEYDGKKIQFIGGAVSIDRTSRTEGRSYWEDEIVKFDREKCKEVDILVTHTTPSWCFPQQFNQTVYGWANEDAYLLEDLTEERAIMDEICKLCKPRLHLYGHFHSSWTERVNGCVHKLLDINEIWGNIEL